MGKSDITMLPKAEETSKRKVHRQMAKSKAKPHQTNG